MSIVRNLIIQYMNDIFLSLVVHIAFRIKNEYRNIIEQEDCLKHRFLRKEYFLIPPSIIVTKARK